ncbi:MAG TPA: tRNA 4-thiouridine(8) synthase ThiI [Syntrophales bacterium]|jgi:tRNA U34 2-thiouridine synthase MnmA/TrmU|nr:tRNA 4-thiouridine(8) synthase ThiI [Syntrophales bacterium]
MNKKAFALLSGGLDSALAVKMLLDQGIEIEAINFMSPFCNCTPKTAGCKSQARKIAGEFGIKIRVISKGMDYMKMVERPPHGYGRGMNPCIDCRIYMLRKVRDLMAAEGVSFIVTGEVLGQRPMSQHRRAIEIIEKEGGLPGLILRPLSAKYFDPTLPEREGIVDRGKLLALSGRSRKPQIELAEKMGITDYPCPAGGCLLTDREIAARLRDLFIHRSGYTMADLHLLKLGRHFRIDPDLKIVVGRNQTENEQIKRLAEPSDTVFGPKDFRGPTVLAQGKLSEALERTIGRIMARYSQEEKSCYTILKWSRSVDDAEFFVEARFSPERLEETRIGEAGVDFGRPWGCAHS